MTECAAPRALTTACLNEVEYAIDDDGWYCGGIKGREGIVTQGRTLEEFCLMIEDARRLMDSEDGEGQQ